MCNLVGRLVFVSCSVSAGFGLLVLVVYWLTRLKRNTFLTSLLLSAVQEFLTMFCGEARLDLMRGARESKGNLVLTRLSYNCQSGWRSNTNAKEPMMGTMWKRVEFGWFL